MSLFFCACLIYNISMKLLYWDHIIETDGPVVIVSETDGTVTQIIVECPPEGGIRILSPGNEPVFIPSHAYTR